MTNREPFIIRDAQEAGAFVTDLCRALNKVFPDPVDPKYRKIAEVPNEA